MPGVISQIEKSLDEDITRYRQLALANTTKKSYGSHLKSYIDFCTQMNYCPIPAELTTILRYTASLAERLSPQSIPSYLNVIRLLHLESGIQNPMEDSHHLSTLLKGIKKDKGVVIKQALPITPHLLLKLRSVLDLSAPYWATLWASCLIAFFAFLRKSNLFMSRDHKHYLIVSNLQIMGGQLCIVLNSTKTIQFKERQILLPLPSVPNHPLCPTTAIKHMLDLSPSQQGGDPLLQFMTPSGLRPLLYSTFIKDLRVLLTKAGIVGGQYSGHSFRWGGASFLLQVGVPGEMIKVMGDWRSDAYQRYLDLSLQTRSNLIRQVVDNLPGGI